MLNFGEHVRSIKKKLQKGNNTKRDCWKRLGLHKRDTGAAQKIAGSDWGCSVTYEAIGRGIMNYGAPFWASTISDTIWNHLQTQQNFALLTITGCVEMSDINDFHNESEMLPVKAHINVCRAISSRQSSEPLLWS